MTNEPAQASEARPIGGSDGLTAGLSIVLAKLIDRIGGRITLPFLETLEILDVGRSAGYKGAHSGEIPTIKIGKQFRVPAAWLIRLASGETNAAMLSVPAGAEFKLGEREGGARPEPDGQCRARAVGDPIGADGRRTKRKGEF